MKTCYSRQEKTICILWLCDEKETTWISRVIRKVGGEQRQGKTNRDNSELFGFVPWDGGIFIGNDWLYTG